MGRTIYDMLKSRISRAEEGVYNPLKLRIGNSMRIDEPDVRDMQFVCTAIREYTRYIAGQSHQFVDYDLVARPYGQEPFKARVRLNPLSTPDPASGLTHNIVVLKMYYECGHQDAVNAGLDTALVAGTGEFDIDWDGTRKYYRINNLQTPYTANVKVLEDRDGNGRVDVNEVQLQVLQYWDFHTQLVNEANQNYVEYLFVERCTETGWYQIWRGSDVIPERISVV